MTVHIGLVLPDLLGTYGDRGNAAVLRQRLRWRGIDAEIVEITLGTPVPESCDIYVLGGAEDAAQRTATEWMRTHPGMQRAAERGAVVLAICAAVQILGTHWAESDGADYPGLGMVDASTTPMATRAIGELVVQPDPIFGTELLTGFENHRGGTVLGQGLRPVGTVRSGIGNGHAGVDGFVSGHVIGTYLHGPCLARNPIFADKLLEWATGHTFTPLALPEVDTLRRERLAAAR